MTVMWTTPAKSSGPTQRAGSPSPGYAPSAKPCPTSPTGDTTPNQWTQGGESDFPPGTWAACAGDATIDDGAEIVVGIDAGKGASDSAIVWVDQQLHVGVKVIEGTGTARD